MSIFVQKINSFNKCSKELCVNVRTASNFSILRQRNSINSVLQSCSDDDIDQSIEKKKFFLDSKLSMRFFDPDVVFFNDNNDIKFVDYKPNREINIPSEFLIDFKLKKNDFNLDLKFEVSWDQHVQEICESSFSFEVNDFQKFQQDFESAKNFMDSCSILEFHYTNLKKKYLINNFSLEEQVKFDLNIKALLFYVVNRKEFFTLHYHKPNSSKLLSKNFKLKIPSAPFYEMWDANRIYSSGDIVRKESKLFIFIDNEFVEFNDYDLKYDCSVFSSLYKQASFFKYDALKNKFLKLLIEKFVGSEVVLHLRLEAQDLLDYNLNNSFKFQGKFFRIFKTISKQDYKGISLYVFGREILFSLNNNFKFDLLQPSSDKNIDKFKIYSFDSIDSSGLYCSIPKKIELTSTFIGRLCV